MASPNISYQYLSLLYIQDRHLSSSICYDFGLHGSSKVVEVLEVAEGVEVKDLTS